MTTILTRKFIDVQPPTHKVGMSGEYNLRVIREDGSVKSETGWFPNIILDAGLNRWGTGSIITGAAIGTGTSTPTAAQTGLAAQTTFTTSSAAGGGTTAQGSAPYFITTTHVYRTALGALNGNYSEVGVGWASGANMFSRALIVDGVGSPTTITVLSSEQLDIVYRLRYYPPLVDTSVAVTIGGVSYTVTGRASLVTSEFSAQAYTGNSVRFISIGATTLSGAIGAITASPSGANGSGAADVVNNAYANNSLLWGGSSTYGLTSGNVAGGIRSLAVYTNIGQFQYDFGASIPKDSTKTLVLNTSATWARRP